MCACPAADVGHCQGRMFNNIKSGRRDIKTARSLPERRLPAAAIVALFIYYLKASLATAAPPPFRSFAYIIAGGKTGSETREPP